MPTKFAKQINSFKVAARGIGVTFNKERHMKIHTLAASSILLAAFIFKFSLTDTLICIVLIGLVYSAELFNTAIELICNILRDRYHLPYEGSRDIRDIAAGAVLVSATTAGVIGVLITLKYL